MPNDTAPPVIVTGLVLQFTSADLAQKALAHAAKLRDRAASLMATTSGNVRALRRPASSDDDGETIEQQAVRLAADAHRLETVAASLVPDVLYRITLSEFDSLFEPLSALSWYRNPE